MNKSVREQFQATITNALVQAIIGTMAQVNKSAQSKGYIARLKAAGLTEDEIKAMATHWGVDHCAACFGEGKQWFRQFSVVKLNDRENIVVSMTKKGTSLLDPYTGEVLNGIPFTAGRFANEQEMEVVLAQLVTEGGRKHVLNAAASIGIENIITNRALEVR